MNEVRSLSSLGAIIINFLVYVSQNADYRASVVDFGLKMI